MLIAACALELGSCWLGIFPVSERVEAMRALLDVPEEVIPFSLVALGHPLEVRGREDRFDPERVHRNRW